MKHPRICDTLLPKRSEFYNQIQDSIKSFIVEVGLFKTFVALSLYVIALQCIEGVTILRGALGIQRISIGEYVNGELTLVIILLMICIYQVYYIDLLIRLGFRTSNPHTQKS